jgi:hypothetical protein
MEREANKLRELQAAAEKEASSGDDGSAVGTEDDKLLADGRSVYVGNVSVAIPEASSLGPTTDLRLIMEPHQKRFKCISKPVELLTE